jgi:hypothetical protein
MPGEETLKGEFAMPYVGKLYSFANGHGATEVLSMGLGYISNQQNLRIGASLDREHVMYSLGAIKSKSSDIGGDI